MIPWIVVRPIAHQRFTTIGDWWEDNGIFTISISEMADWRHEVLVLVHELTEWAICQVKGISTVDCDRFDALWEKELSIGLQWIEDEAGFDQRCPYRSGHIWGCRMERLFAWLLGVRWREYVRVCDEMMRSRAR